MEDVVRTVDARRGPLSIRNVYGLNALAASRVPVEPEHDPRIVFLRGAADRPFTCALVGGLALEGEDCQTFLRIETRVARTRTAVVGGTFYNALELDARGCLVRSITSSLMRTTPTNWLYALTRDALALFIGVHGGNYHALHRLLTRGADNDDALLQRFVTLCRVVIRSHGDGGNFSLIASDAGVFEDLRPPLHSAAQAVVQSDWYRAMRNRLEWDDEYDLCLKLPEQTHV